MPTVTIDPYMTIYQERADLDYSWDEEGVNRYGLRSHARKPGNGVQWDPTGQQQFEAFGTRKWGAPTARLIGYYASEGNHETNTILVYTPPVGRVTATDARLNFFDQAGGQFYVFGVATDNLVTRALMPWYPATYRSETHPNTWGSARRYRADSYEHDQQHTEAEVVWHQPPGVGMATPNLAPVLNEIMSRPGWKAGNRLGLVFGCGWKMLTDAYPPGSPGPAGWSVGTISDGYLHPEDQLRAGNWMNAQTRPTLSITY